VAGRKRTAVPPELKLVRVGLDGERHWKEVYVDLTEVKRLAEAQCSVLEAAASLHLSEKEFKRACHEDGEVFAAWDGGKHAGRARLRLAQYATAIERNPTLLIWLGKQFLGQRDKTEVTGLDGGPIQTVAVDLSKLSVEEVAALNGIAERLAAAGVARSGDHTNGAGA